MKTALIFVLSTLFLVAYANTFGRVAINDHFAAKAAQEMAQYKADKLAKDIAACESGKTTAIMVNGKFCAK